MNHGLLAFLQCNSTSFFTHLVNVLEPVEYLAPVVMLLAEKHANRVARQSYAEAQVTLSLPLGVLLHYDNLTRLSVSGVLDVRVWSHIIPGFEGGVE